MMTLFSSQPGDEGLPGPARARVMAAIMTTTLMGVFDGTMINIALPSMAQEMQVPASIAVWFANGYLLAAAMTLAIFAALAARLGYRPVFLAGLTTFTLTSLGCALANKPEVLIGMRVLQGSAAARAIARNTQVRMDDYLAAFWGSMPCSLPPAPLSARYWAVRSFTP
jgi:DHA2 family multidrug resistance protein-like MFS transporter